MSKANSVQRMLPEAGMVCPPLRCLLNKAQEAVLLRLVPTGPCMLSLVQ